MDSGEATTDFADRPPFVIPAWTKTSWGHAATFEMRQRLDQRMQRGEEITAPLALKEAQDVLKCYRQRGHDFYEDLHCDDTYISGQAKKEVAALHAYINQFSGQSTSQ